MKPILLLTLLVCTRFAFAQTPSENIIIITTDGLRWQELFKGMDSAIANNSRYNEGDSSYIFHNYWAATEEERRKKLMPFFWNNIGKMGQAFGNRVYKNEVDVSNPHSFSYPGYSEIFTGFGDPDINSNSYPANPHTTVLEYLHQQPRYRNKVAAFGAWFAFDRILNEKRSGFPVINAFDTVVGSNLTQRQQLVNSMLKDSYKPWGSDECLDVFTHYAAMEYLKINKPRVLFIGYGETDEWAHAGKYRSYLDAAWQVDAWLKELWDYLQNDAQYKNKTTVFFTTDHGRGDVKKTQWTSHSSSIVGANEIWFAAWGNGVQPKGEIKTQGHLFQQRFAQTFAASLGLQYKAKHPIADSFWNLLSK